MVTVLQGDPEVDVLDPGKRDHEGRSGAVLLIAWAVYINRANQFTAWKKQNQLPLLIALEKPQHNKGSHSILVQTNIHFPQVENKKVRK